MCFCEEETAHWLNEKNYKINSEVEKIIGRQKLVTEPKDIDL